MAIWSSESKNPRVIDLLSEIQLNFTIISNEIKNHLYNWFRFG